MSAARIEMHRLQELIRLHRMGTGPREVARLLAMSPKTELHYRRALADAELLEGPVDEVPDVSTLRAALDASRPRLTESGPTSSVAPWAETIEAKWKGGASPKVIYDFLRLEKKDFTGSYQAVKRYCARLKRERGVRPEDVAIPVVTEPGEVAQVDFGYVGKLYDAREGRLRKAWVFVMVLGFSRHLFAKVVFDQKVRTWVQLHVEAFRWFGGVVSVVVPDNLKAAVVRAAFSPEDEIGLNRTYRELARHYGFKIDPTPPRAPKKKGKVESSVKYVKRSYFGPRNPADIDEANEGLVRWILEIAGTRTHGSTHKQPLVAFEKEESAILQPLPSQPFVQLEWKTATVRTDSHILFGRRLFSVPWPWIGRQVWVRATASTVDIYGDDVLLASHDRQGDKERSTVDAHMPDHRSDYRHRSRRFWEERAHRIGPKTGAYIREVFDSDDVLYQLRTVQAMVTHLEGFPTPRAEAACVRAGFYGNHTYKSLKRILRLGLDLEPLPTALASARGELEHPRYARSVQELLDLEVTDESH